MGGRNIQKKTYPHPYEETFQASLESVKKLGWKLVSQDRLSGSIKAKTGATLRSWGEDVFIKVSKEPTGSTISVSSEASSQLFDWGKSKENERVFHKKLKETILR